MARDKVITVMCAARLPEVLVARIDKAAESGGVSRAQFIAEACRRRLDGPAPPTRAVTSPKPEDYPGKFQTPIGDEPKHASVETLRNVIKTIEQGHAACDPEYRGVPPIERPIEELRAEYPIVPDVCGFRAFNDIDGETYTCGLPKHSAKAKHGSWVLSS